MIRTVAKFVAVKLVSGYKITATVTLMLVSDYYVMVMISNSTPEDCNVKMLFDLPYLSYALNVTREVSKQETRA